jgi:hypothetical protein
MYTLTAQDKQPRTLFGKVYYWSTDDTGTLHLISLARLQATMREVLPDA